MLHTRLQPPVEGFWYGDTGGLSRAVRRDRRDESVQLVPEKGNLSFHFRGLSFQRPLKAKFSCSTR